jgi:ATP-binding cassette, subfamily C, bacterial LapB
MDNALSALTPPPSTPLPPAAVGMPPRFAALDDIKRISQQQAAVVDPVLVCIELLCSHQGSPLPAAVLGAGLSLRQDGRVDPSQLLQAAQAHGLLAQFSPIALDKISAFALPVVLLLQDGGACVLLRAPTSPGAKANAEGLATVLLPESGPTEHEIGWSELKARYSGHALYVKPHRAVDERGDHAPEVRPTRWFWDILARYKSYYLHVGLATVVVNVLSLVASMFAMTVYDRVIPNQAFSTLWVLAIGVGCATGFEFLARMLRSWLTDVAGKKADVVMSSVLFRRVLNLRLDQKPQSAGSFANTLRDYESVRDFVTSATLLALADLPFVLLFLGVMVVVAGPLAWVPAVAMAFILVVTLAAQWPIANLMALYMRGMSRKQSIAVETVEGLEALRANRAESVMQTRWDDCNASIAAFSAKSRLINAWVMNTVSTVQQGASVALIIWGVYAIADNALTMGGLIAASILAGRAIAPISQVAGLGLRWQQARTSLKGLNELMQRAQDRDGARSYVHAPSLSGAVALQNITHRFGGPDAAASLDRAA